MTLFTGVAASEGTACGPVIAIRSEGIPAAVPPGGILVARVVHPYLAPLFFTLGGVIVEDGGILQHAVILAREFGLPAVVGVTDALTYFDDGDEVSIDGSTGEVRIIVGDGD